MAVISAFAAVGFLVATIFAIPYEICKVSCERIYYYGEYICNPTCKEVPITTLEWVFIILSIKCCLWFLIFIGFYVGTLKDKIAQLSTQQQPQLEPQITQTQQPQFQQQPQIMQTQPMMQNFVCPNCRNQVRPDARFCQTCGTQYQ